MKHFTTADKVKIILLDVISKTSDIDNIELDDILSMQAQEIVDFFSGESPSFQSFNNVKDIRLYLKSHHNAEMVKNACEDYLKTEKITT